jgi:hypothetical protein
MRHSIDVILILNIVKLHMVQYPTLSRMARDYLAIQGSAVPSERAFSSGGLTATARRNRLSGDIFEALQILKSGYRNGHIRASEQAEAHFSTYVKELADSEVDSDMPALE